MFWEMLFEEMWKMMVVGMFLVVGVNEVLIEDSVEILFCVLEILVLMFLMDGVESYLIVKFI